MLEGFTGYLLPWDQTAYWATVVGININGDRRRSSARSSRSSSRAAPRSAPTRSRASTRSTCSCCPGALIGADRAAPVPRRSASASPRRRGRRRPPGRERPEADDRRARRASSQPAPRGDGGTDGEPSEQPRRAPRASFKRYKEDVKKRGKPFFPYAMFHDTVMSLVVVRRDHRARGASGSSRSRATTRATEPGWLGPLYDEPGRPGHDRASCRGRTGTSTSSSTCCGSSSGRSRSSSARSAIPTICMILLLALPFIDRRRERRLLAPAGRDGRRDPRRRLDGRAHLQGRDREGGARERGRRRRADAGSKENNLPDRRRSPGAKLFAAVGLPQLPHVPRQRLVEPRRARPDRRSGRKNRGVEFQIGHLKCPSCVNPGSPMPPFAGARRRAARSSSRSSSRLEGRQQAAAPREPCAMRVFLGITGASGRSVRGAAARGARRRAGCEVGVCASGAGIEVLATELYGDARLSRDEVLARFSSARDGAVDGLRPERLARAVRERLGEGRRLRDLPVLDGDARHDRRRARWRT